MTSRLSSPILAVDMARVASVDASNVDNLFSMWTIFSKCAESLENGRRLENLSWRLWNRETFCCDHQSAPLPPSANPGSSPSPSSPPTAIATAKATATTTPTTPTTPTPPAPSATTTPTAPSIAIRTKPIKRQLDAYAHMPELTSSVDSAPSEDELAKQRLSAPFCRAASTECYRGKEWHMSSVNLAKIVEKMYGNGSAADEWKRLRKAASMPVTTTITTTPAAATAPATNTNTTTAAAAAAAAATTAATTAPVANSASAATASAAATTAVAVTTGAEPQSSHSVVRGFSPSCISSSYRSASNAAATSPSPAKLAATATPVQQKKKPVFFIGSSSSSSDDDLDDSYGRAFQEKTHPAEAVAGHLRNDHGHDGEDDDEDDEVSESGIEEDDLEWESSSESGHSSCDDGALFKRVESRPGLTSHRSLLSTMLHEPQRAAQLQETASPREQQHPPPPPPPPPPPMMMMLHHPPGAGSFPGPKPIRCGTVAVQPLALSPRTTRRNMLATELTESLRKHLLWEHQQQNTSASANLKRRHTAADVTRLVEFPARAPSASKNNSWNNRPFDGDEYEYHAAGW